MMTGSETPRFDRLIRAFTASRRSLIGGMVLTAMVELGASGDAAKRRRRNTKRPRRNRFGCVDVGGKCFGKSDACCSGICDGTKSKSRCIAHHEEGCLSDRSSCSEATLCGEQGRCYQTTGNAGFCANGGLCDCAACQRDSDCEGRFGPGAACIVCGDCVGVKGSNGTACVPTAT